ncbi:MAG: hypothetical protein ACRD3T_13350 [Terriglobia bacterium]
MDCDNNWTYYDVTLGASWSSNHTSVCSIASAGIINENSPGSCTITAQFISPKWIWDAGLCAHAFPEIALLAYAYGTVGAYPVNFHVNGVSKLTNGTLEFDYEWRSSDGNMSDLSSCGVTETVNYPGSGNYVWPEPPWYTTTINPDTGPVPPAAGSAGGLIDDQQPGTFLKPYKAAGFTATQTYNYSCHSGALQGTLLGPLSIVRSVTKNSNGTYKYTVTKSGYENSVNPLP